MRLAFSVRRATAGCCLAAAAGILLWATQASAAGPATSATAPAATSPSAAAPATQAASAPAAMTGSASSTTSAPAPSDEDVPEASSFKVTDNPDDDGSAIRVQWARPAKESNDIEYVVEIARSPEDFANNRFKSKTIAPSPPDADDLYETEIIPSSPKFFPPPPRPPLTGERLKELADQSAITSAEFARATAILDDMHRAASRPSAKSRPTMESMPSPEGMPATASAPATASMPSTASMPGAESEPTSQSKPSEERSKDNAWFQSLTEYVHGRDWLKSFAIQDRRAITDEQLTRGLAALAAQFREEDTPQAKSEVGWLERLTTYLKKKDQKVQRAEKAAINGSTWYVRLAARRGGHVRYVSQDSQPVVLSASAQPNWYKWSKSNNLIFALAFCGIVFAFIQIAKRNPNLFIRKIGGLEAVDEAIGRSTEMDRPVFFIHGLGAMGDLSTIASVNILSRAARRTAEYDTRIRVMNNDPIVTAVSQEVVQQAYMQAGRPDAYNPDDVSLVAYDQFSYVAAVSGNMVRERPGAIFLMGYFYAESLLLAETGASTGAIQVAGTDSYTQLPFFITTCDYTLIGEELYAASAYLSREPRLLGSLRGQDVGKAFLMIAMAAVSVLLTVGVALGLHWDWLRNLLNPGLG